MANEAGFELVDAPALADSAAHSWSPDYRRPAVDAALLDSPGVKPQNVIGVEDVIGGDDRRRVTDVTVFPMSALVALQITYDDHNTATGTGWLASSNVVITAGHCLLRHKGAGTVSRARSARVIVLANDVIPAGSLPSTQFWDVFPPDLIVSQDWPQLVNGRPNPAADYGAIRLNEPIGAKLNWMLLGQFSDQQLTNLPFNIAGYPNDPFDPGKPFATMWGQTGSLQNPSEAFLTYDIDTTEGQSGCPVFAMSNGKAWVAGLHISGSSSVNTAVRVNPRVYAEISAWL